MKLSACLPLIASAASRVLRCMSSVLGERTSLPRYKGELCSRSFCRRFISSTARTRTRDAMRKESTTTAASFKTYASPPPASRAFAAGYESPWSFFDNSLTGWARPLFHREQLNGELSSAWRRAEGRDVTDFGRGRGHGFCTPKRMSFFACSSAYVAQGCSLAAT